MKLSPPRRLGLLLAACSAVLVAGCDSGTTAPSDGGATGTPSALQLSPDAVELVVGNHTNLSVTAADRNGVRLPGTNLSLTWRSSDPNIVSVDGSGAVTARAAGSATIVAQFGKVKAEATVRALEPTLKAVKFAAREVRLSALGDTVRLAVDVVWNGTGKPALKWTSVDPGVASINTDGLVTAVSAGTARIVVAAGNQADTARVVVQPVPASLVVTPAATTINSIGDTLRLSAVLVDAKGRAVPGTSFTWVSLSPKVATVDSMGVLVSRSVGLALVTVAAGGRMDTASINVRQVPASITVAPTALTIAAGQNGNLAASAADSNGVAIPGLSFSWSTSDAAVATVSAQGVVKALKAGTASITAASGGQSGTATVTVSAAAADPVASVTLSPTTLTLDPGGTQAISAFIKDAAGNLLSGRQLAWTSSNAAVAKVGSDGVVTAVAAGSATITATSEGKSATLAVTVKGSAVAPPTGKAVDFIIGPQLPVASAQNPWPWFDQAAISNSDYLTADPARWQERSHGYYYDFALTQYTLYHRTGDSRYLKRAREAADYWWTTNPIGQGDFRSAGQTYAPREVALGGLILRALDGRPEMWDWITWYTRTMYSTWLGKRLDNPKLYYGIRDGGYMLLYTAWLAEAHPDAAVRAEMRNNALQAATRYYARLQRADGSWRWVGTGADAIEGEFMQPFMVGLLLEGMIATHQLTGDVVVKQAILKSVDNLWSVAYDRDTFSPQRNVKARAVYYFNYGDTCEAGCGNTPDPSKPMVVRSWRQRNSLVVHAFGYAYHISGDPKYRTWGDEIFAATYGNGQGPLADGERGLADGRGKEYNQAFRSAGRYLSWRR